MSERTVTFKGNPVPLCGAGVSVGDAAPEFSATAGDLSQKTLADYAGKVVVISAVPSLDTPVCDTETRRFNEEAGKLGDSVAVLTVSADLPFAQGRWCGAAGVENVTTLSTFPESNFGDAFGLTIADGALKGLLARAVYVVNKEGNISYGELVPEIAQEPDYDAAIEAVKSAS